MALNKQRAGLEEGTENDLIVSPLPIHLSHFIDLNHFIDLLLYYSFQFIFIVTSISYDIITSDSYY